jgi:hypothetical protein
VQATLPWGRIVTVGLILVVVILFAGILISSYATNTTVSMEGGVPIIRADKTEFRTRPEQPGGIDIPNQDRLVLQDLGRKQAPLTVASVLPPPEQPMPRPAAAGSDQRGWRLPLPAASAGAGVLEILLPRAGQAAGPVQAPAPVVPPIAAPDASVAPAADPSAPATTAAADPSAPAPSPESAAAAADPIAALLNGQGGTTQGWVDPDSGTPMQMAALPTPPSAAVPAMPAIAAVAGGHFAVQIAAVATPEEAQAEWARFQRRFPELFGTLQLAAPQVSATARLGYRVQAVPLDQATATRLCDALASEKTGCLVVPR